MLALTKPVFLKSSPLTYRGHNIWIARTKTLLLVVRTGQAALHRAAFQAQETPKKHTTQIAAAA